MCIYIDFIGAEMDKQVIIRKVMSKLGMIGEPSDPVEDRDKQRFLKLFWNEREPRNVIKILQTFFQKESLSKEAKQDLFKFFKLKGLFKRSLTLHKDMEKAWRLLLKESDLKGFLLEN